VERIVHDSPRRRPVTLEDVPALDGSERVDDDSFSPTVGDSSGLIKASSVQAYGEELGEGLLALPDDG